MSNPENQQDQGRRKSKRPRVPNPYYTAGINQLKKITLKAQSKKNRTDQDGDYSSQQEQNISNNGRNYQQNYYSYQKQESSGKWLSCLLPNTTKPIKIQIVIDSSQSPLIQPIKQKDEPIIKQSAFIPQSQQVFIPTYNSGQLSKKSQPSGALNLLSLFQKVIKNVSDQVSSPVKHPNLIQPASYHQNNLQEPQLKYQVSNQKQNKAPPVLAVPPKRIIEQDKDGKIIQLSVDKETKTLNIEHSKLGQCAVPIQVEPPVWNFKQQQTQEDQQIIDGFRKKLDLNPSILKSMSIYN